MNDSELKSRENWKNKSESHTRFKVEYLDETVYLNKSDTESMTDVADPPEEKQEFDTEFLKFLKKDKELKSMPDAIIEELEDCILHGESTLNHTIVHSLRSKILLTYVPNLLLARKNLSTTKIFHHRRNTFDHVLR